MAVLAGAVDQYEMNRRGYGAFHAVPQTESTNSARQELSRGIQNRRLRPQEDETTLLVALTA
jgi:hypothetical protein